MVQKLIKQFKEGSREEAEAVQVYVDLFCGGGGSTTGVLQAMREIDPVTAENTRCIAVNHDPAAIATHAYNHPNVEHYDCDIEQLDPAKVLGGDRIRFLWASAPCQPYSRAAGGPTTRDQGRATPDYIRRWLEVGQPEVYVEENVWEITTKWTGWEDHVQYLRDQGYTVEYRLLKAADYGLPQDRRRMILLAIKGDHVVPWPVQTHSDPKAPVPGTEPWVGAIEALDLSLPVRSVFNRRTKTGKDASLAFNTRKRIARYLRDQGTFWEILADAVEANEGPVSLEDALNALPKEEWPECIQACGDHYHVQAMDAFLDKQYGTGRCQGLDRPAGTVTTGGGRGGGHLSVVQPFVQGQHGGNVIKSVDRPAPTLATAGYINVGVVGIRPPEGSYRGNLVRDAGEPSPTVTAARGGETWVVKAGVTSQEPGLLSFLYRYNGNALTRSLRRPAPTVTCVEGHMLVTVTARDLYLDVGTRMCTVRELARLQGFPDDYVFLGPPGARGMQKGAKVRQIGNAVPVALARAVIYAVLDYLQEAAA